MPKPQIITNFTPINKNFLTIKTYIMNFNENDFVIESTADGGFFAYLSSNLQCNAYGDSYEEAEENLRTNVEEFIDTYYNVEEY